MKRLVIVGAGNSIRPELQNGLWDKLRNEYTFVLNDVIYFFNPTVPICVDWYWYRERYDIINKFPLSICKYDKKFDATHPEVKVPNISNNTIFLNPSSNYYHGKDSWKKGFYSGVLCGCFALTFGIALGFKEIYLLGFDFCGINGKTHFYEKDKLKDQIIGVIKEKNGQSRCGIGKDARGNYRTGVYNNTPEKYFGVYKQEKETKIFNVSKESKIKTFQKISYKNFYRRLDSENIKINQDDGVRQIRQILTNKLGE